MGNELNNSPKVDIYARMESVGRWMEQYEDMIPPKPKYVASTGNYYGPDAYSIGTSGYTMINYKTANYQSPSGVFHYV